MHEQLARGPEFVRQLIYELPQELRKRRPAPGVWSAHEHAVHVPATYPLVVRTLYQMLHDLYHAYRIEERLLRKHWD